MMLISSIMLFFASWSLIFWNFKSWKDWKKLNPFKCFVSFFIFLWFLEQQKNATKNIHKRNSTCIYAKYIFFKFVTQWGAVVTELHNEKATVNIFL